MTHNIVRARVRRRGLIVRVAFLLSRFPVRSQTFVINQITGLLDRGADVEILAGNPTEALPRSGEVALRGLLARTRSVRMPETIPAQLATAVARALPLLRRNPRLVLRAFDVRKYGFAAMSGRLFHMATGLSRPTRYDVIHAHFGPTGVLGLALRDLGIIEGRLCTVFHGFDMTEVVRLFGSRTYARLFAEGDLFLPISETWRRRLLAMGAPPERTHVHRMGIDVQRFNPGEMRRAAGPVRLLSVGRLVEKKGFGDALAAVARLPRDLDVRYRIVGTGPLEAALRESIAKLGVTERVELAGALDHEAVRAAMLDADIFLAPSVTARNGDQEGIPVTIMEAMATELPVLSTRHSGIPELVADGGIRLPRRRARPRSARHPPRVARARRVAAAYLRACRARECRA